LASLKEAVDYDSVVIADATTNYELTVPAGQGDYYSVRIECSVGTFAITSCNIVVNNDCFCHLPARDFNLKAPLITSSRVLGTSLKYTNTAALNDLQGEIAMAQMHPNLPWNQVVNTTFNTVAATSHSSVINSREGAYEWLIPNSPTDFDFVSEFSYDYVLLGLTSTRFAIDNSSEYLAMWIRITDASGQTGFFTLANNVEYTTNATTENDCASEFSAMQCSNALEALTSVPQYTTNPIHWEEIWNSIKSGAKSVLDGVVKYAPMVAEAASTIGALF